MVKWTKSGKARLTDTLLKNRNVKTEEWLNEFSKKSQHLNQNR